MGNFYTYLWLRDDGTPYYAGKGKGNRAFTKGSHRVKCPKDSSQIIVQEWLSEEDAFDAEKFLIAYYGRLDLGTGCLRNLTDGGEGFAGLVFTPEHVAALIIGQTGCKKTRSPEHAAKIREIKKNWHAERKKLGIVVSDDTKTKTSDSLKRHYAAIPDSVRDEMKAVRKRWWASEAGLKEREKRSHAGINRCRKNPI